MSNLLISHLDELESEAIYVIREVAANFEKPAILFSGGKDSILVTQLAKKAFYPAKIPFPLVHIDTGHNFPETMTYRDNLVAELGVKLIVGSVQEMIDKGMAVEKARAKERFFSHRDEFGQWDPKNQRPELWNLYNTKKNMGEHFRVFPISNWTELDVWQYFAKEKIQLPSLYFAHKRRVFERNGVILSESPCSMPRENETVEERTVRFRTMGDITITGAYPSEAATIEEVIQEIAASMSTERGTRADDKRSDTAMEDRKKEGYF